MAKAAKKAATKSAAKSAPTKSATKSAAPKPAPSKAAPSNQKSSASGAPDAIRWTAIEFEAELVGKKGDGFEYRYTSVPEGHHLKGKSVVFSEQNLNDLLTRKAVEPI